ncbi:TLR4 interactor with leucine rich repeats [Xenopus laevis]|uniref:TLR4 interactor with leucine rich repeats n=2 Tax=Xenopus laevis TaxID=8355 RepID=A0A1D8DGQ8_XENLA|nr:TLR4 interactor with leucine rich repeats [Xenopus laevis]AOS89757.1 TLR4 interactor with leucine rich repeats.S [Xenopus laevis]OCT75823.1 hypothetical protein XELAEV_18031010mg [Xenopus laevis]
MAKAAFIDLLVLLACTLAWSVEPKCLEPCDCQHLQHILCSNRGLLSVPKSSQILSASGTKTYSLGGNFISNISVLDFVHFPQLQRLDLQYNQIRSIHLKAFEKLPELEELYLGNNLLTTLAPGALAPLRKLKVLNVNGNRLHNISRASFSNLAALIKLRLDGNDIQNLQGSPFSALSNLLYLHLENNKITNISKNVFTGLGKLRLLSLSGNPQSFLRQPTFLPLRSLSTLTMAGNQLQQLGPSMFNGLQRLSRLILSSNQISAIQTKTFLGLDLLQELHLDGNKLVQLPEGVLVPLHNLEVLNLSRNAISHLHPEMFKGLMRLKVLDLQHNMLRYLSGQTFAGNPVLYRLQLDGNRWNCDCHLLDLKHWILGTLHPRSRMLTVFVQCWEPQKVAGKYLDYLEDAYLLGVGGCQVSTTPAGQEQIKNSTLRDKHIGIHQPGKGDRDLKNGADILRAQPKTEEKSLHLPTLPSEVSPALETLALRQQALVTKWPSSTNRDSTAKNRGLETSRKGKGKSVKNAAEHSRKLHLLSQPVHPTQSKVKQMSVLIPASSNLPPHSESLHSEKPSQLDPPSVVPYTDDLKSAYATLQHNDTTDKPIHHDKTLHQSPSDTLLPNYNSFQQAEGDPMHPAPETLHQVAPFPSLLSDPCEFNKLYLVNLSVESVGSSTARVRWQTISVHTQGPVLFRVLYERFGQTGRFQRFVYPRGRVESLTLQELTGKTPYLVCVESIIGGRACPVAPRDHCIGIVTLPSEDDRPLLNYQVLALSLLAVNALLLLLGLVAWGSRLAHRKWGRRRPPVHVRQMYSTRRPYRSVGTGVSTDFSGFQSHRPRTTVCALGEADLIEFPGCDRFREGGNIHREDLLQRFTD